jgi:hypothetical protein
MLSPVIIEFATELRSVMTCDTPAGDRVIGHTFTAVPDTRVSLIGYWISIVVGFTGGAVTIVISFVIALYV